ncbi:hypothetical protein EVAR_79308_1 [Eumeta japonica]|uniref:Uncharacterized protein n=1 Tax=Eumeta variegata TaxID=151549 RepID=A0A4C1THP4_EUMVA|nr:hypothetical protein EVAR_79308_1 [Eumeta japonica]
MITSSLLILKSVRKKANICPFGYLVAARPAAAVARPRRAREATRGHDTDKSALRVRYDVDDGSRSKTGVESDSRIGVWSVTGIDNENSGETRIESGDEIGMDSKVFPYKEGGTHRVSTRATPGADS